MKKIIALISLLLLTACTNTSNHDYNTETFAYKYVHVECTTNAVMHDEIEKWYNDNDGTLCYIKTKNYGWICLNGNFMLYNSARCPLCNK